MIHCSLIALLAIDWYNVKRVQNLTHDDTVDSCITPGWKSATPVCSQHAEIREGSPPSFNFHCLFFRMLDPRAAPPLPAPKNQLKLQSGKKSS
ncbi:hypothetical protein AVEN_201935-1 [Araneus ventricosus]|uniref:Uncharacterized protein n=1 Tax=Araneus ventricosus TaxID=182803 RepID=A0A4Y2P8N1_ARAVE|nr:hypothetical protein AVEN_201935-1 [Araneus ventricosus]